MFALFSEDAPLDDRTTIVISNCVVTAYLGKPVDLERVARACYGELNPVSFAALKLRLLKPSTTALVFASGKIVCTGASSERTAYTALLEFCRVIRTCDADVTLLDVKFQNMVSSGSFGCFVNLEKLFERVRRRTMVIRWNPQIFPGLRYQPTGSPALKTFAVVFATGRVVMTAAKNRNEIRQTWRRVWRDVAPCTTEEEVTHTSLVKRQRLMELYTEDPEDEIFDAIDAV